MEGRRVKRKRGKETMGKGEREGDDGKGREGRKWRGGSRRRGREIKKSYISVSLSLTWVAGESCYTPAQIHCERNRWPSPSRPQCSLESLSGLASCCNDKIIEKKTGKSLKSYAF